MRVTLQTNLIPEFEFRGIVDFINAYIIGQSIHKMDYRVDLDEVIVSEGTGPRGTNIKCYVADFWIHENRYSKFDKEYFIYFFSNVLKFNRLPLNLLVMDHNFDIIFKLEANSRKVLQVQIYDDK